MPRGPGPGEENSYKPQSHADARPAFLASSLTEAPDRVDDVWFPDE
jgi:hypothetical protein